MAEFQGLSTSDMSQAEHLNPQQIAAYLDHELTDDGRDRVEQHLETCAECRAELHAAARLVDSWPPSEPTTRQAVLPRNTRRVRYTLLGTLAAAVVLMVFSGPRLLRNTTQPDASRAPSLNEGRTHLEIITPIPDSVVVAHPLVFTWHSSSASLYRVTVLTESGEPIYSVDTRDTSVVLPDSVNLSPGENYFWRADGTGNGIVSSTGAAWLRIKR